MSTHVIEEQRSYYKPENSRATVLSEGHLVENIPQAAVTQEHCYL